MNSPVTIDRYFHPQTRHPALLGIGFSEQRRPRSFAGMHQHEVTEFCCVLGGEIDYQTEGHSYTIPPDHLHVSWPGEIHGSPHGMIPPCRLHWISYDLNPYLEGGSLDRLRERHRRPLLPGASHAFIPLIEAIRRECSQPRRDTPSAIDAYLRIFTIQLVRLLEVDDAHDITADPQLKRALDFIEAADLADLRIQAIAQRLGLSRTHLHQLFVRHLGISPKRYLQERRLKKAAEAVTGSNRTMTDIALDLGFASSQHFAAAFRNRFGKTPSQFREERQTTL